MLDAAGLCAGCLMKDDDVDQWWLSPKIDKGRTTVRYNGKLVSARSYFDGRRRRYDFRKGPLPVPEDEMEVVELVYREESGTGPGRRHSPPRRTPTTRLSRVQRASTEASESGGFNAT